MQRLSRTKEITIKQSESVGLGLRSAADRFTLTADFSCLRLIDSVSPLDCASQTRRARLQKRSQLAPEASLLASVDSRFKNLSVGFIEFMTFGRLFRKRERDRNMMLASFDSANASVFKCSSFQFIRKNVLLSIHPSIHPCIQHGSSGFR